MTNDKRDELLRDHGEQIAKHIERFDYLKADLLRIEKNQGESSTTSRTNNEKLVSIDERLGHLEKRVEELRTRRWELIKLLVAALLGVLITRGYDLLIKKLEPSLPLHSDRAR